MEDVLGADACIRTIFSTNLCDWFPGRLLRDLLLRSKVSLVHFNVPSKFPSFIFTPQASNEETKEHLYETLLAECRDTIQAVREELKTEAVRKT